MCSINKQATKLAYLGCVLVSLSTATFARIEAGDYKSGVKFAFYSSAWSVDSNDGMRLVLFNENDVSIHLSSIVFQKDNQNREGVEVRIDKEIPPLSYATSELEYIDLLQQNDCIERTLNKGWKLTEISNYTLNPAVRNLIIEDTDSFRIYQCLENVRTFWSIQGSDDTEESDEWIIFHFETI